MTKKPYEAPEVKKVHLVIQNSVLQSCKTTSTQGNPHNDYQCKIVGSCHYKQ